MTTLHHKVRDLRSLHRREAETAEISRREKREMTLLSRSSLLVLFFSFLCEISAVSASLR
jgi:hypothetical protein